MSLFIVVLIDAEPHYNRKSLSEWIGVWFRAQQNQNQETLEVATEAIRHIGINAIPVLLDRLTLQPTSTKIRLSEFLKKTGVQSQALFNYTTSDEIKAAEVEWIIGVLGPIASPAIPELTEVANNTNNPISIRERAIFSLIGIGDESLPFFKEALSDVQHPACTEAAFCLSARQLTNFPSATNLVPYLASLSVNTNKVGQYAAKALTSIETNRLTLPRPGAI